MHIFKISKIIFSKKFKKNIFNNLKFTNKFYLQAVNKIYLIDQQNKAFYLLYTKIEKI